MRPRLASGPQAALIRFAIRFRGIVIALAFILLGYGFYALTRASFDVFPEFAPPQVGIQTEAPGLTPEQVEVLITRPIENAINGVPGVQQLRSTSIQGLSLVTVFFDPAGDIYRDRQVVAERLVVAAQQLPEGTQPPAMTPLTSSTSTVLVIDLSSESRSLMDLRTAADWTVRLRLLAVPGVAKVVVFGGDIRSIQIQIHPDRLIQYQLSLSEVLTAARRATGVRGAGFIDTRNQRVVFQSEGQSLTADDIARTVLLSHGAASVSLANVADVVEAAEPPIGGAAIQGSPGVVINVAAQFGANTVEVTKAVEAALEELRNRIGRQICCTCSRQLVARSAGDHVGPFGSDQGKCGHAPRLAEPSVLTHSGNSRLLTRPVAAHRQQDCRDLRLPPAPQAPRQARHRHRSDRAWPSCACRDESASRDAPTVSGFHQYPRCPRHGRLGRGRSQSTPL
jgi:Cu/Ag efflux pump CusA